MQINYTTDAFASLVQLINFILLPNIKITYSLLKKISIMKYLKPNILFFLFISSIIFAQTEKIDTCVMNQFRIPKAYKN